MTTDPGSSTVPAGGFRRRFVSLFLLGLVGVASLPLALVPLLRHHPLPPGAPKLPLPALVAISMINPILYLAGAVALGAKFAPRVGLVSYVARRAETGLPVWPALRGEVRGAVVGGLLVAGATALLDLAFAPFLGAAWARAAAQADEGGAGALVSGVLYGGITEELMLRWGVLSFLLWLGTRLPARGDPRPGPGVAWGAILVAALLFGAGHLPAVAALAPLTPALVARTVLLNALGGAFFGWLYWRRSLEAAMVAHASTHVGFAVVSLLGVVVP